MTTLTENPRASEFIASEAPGMRSREQITVKSGASLKAGAVIAAVITAATVASAAKSGGNTGNGTFTPDATLAALPGAIEGVYQLRCVAAAANGGTFQLIDPNGKSLGHFVLAAGSVTVNSQIKGVIADGAADFVVGDGFDVTVSALTKKYVQLAPAGTDGSQIAAGILYGPVDATSADKRGVAVVRAAEVNANLLTWPGGITATQKTVATRQLAELGISLRS